MIDYERIHAQIRELVKRFRIEQIAIDRWNATQLATRREDDGFRIVSFDKGYVSMSAPTKKQVQSQKLRHAGHKENHAMIAHVVEWKRTGISKLVANG